MQYGLSRKTRIQHKYKCRSTHLVESLEHVLVIRLVGEISLERGVHSGLNQHGVVDAAEANISAPVPAGSAAAELSAFHDVVQQELLGVELEDNNDVIVN